MENDKFQDWMRKRIRFVGEELIRRSEKLTLGGIDLVTDVDINIHIPTARDDIGWPSLKITFSCGEKVYTDELVSGEFDYKWRT